MKKTDLVNVLILGSGGREHAIAWKIAQSKLLNNLYVAPGNSGTSSMAKNIPANINNCTEIKDIIITKSIDLLIIGPEDPLVNGLRDELEKEDKTIDTLFTDNIVADIELKPMELFYNWKYNETHIRNLIQHNLLINFISVVLGLI